MAVTWPRRTSRYRLPRHAGPPGQQPGHPRHPNHEEAATLALPSDAAVLAREDIYKDRRGNAVDFTRTVWPGDTTRLILGD